MGSLNPPPELTLDLKPTFIPKTINQLLEELSRIGNISEKILKVDDLISRLETEMRKIDAFKRELPLCMLLINNAIAALKDESMAFKKSSNTHPVLEEFIPINKTCNEDAEVEKMVKEIGGNDKKNWLSSTQLWNSNDVDPNTYQIQNQKPHSKDQTTKKRTVEEDDVITVNDSSQQFRNINRSFIPLKGCYGFTMMGSIRDDIHITSEFKNSIRRNNLITKSSHDDQSNLPTGGSRGSPHQQQTSRKQRRCWSTELHRQFVNALQQLGGSQVATPKQIRELMQVDGLTNDEVKSHLQKYRLHTRRIPSSNTAYVESSKRLICQSGSPDGPLLIGSTTGGTSTTGGDSMDDEEESKSENYCWKSV